MSKVVRKIVGILIIATMGLSMVACKSVASKGEDSAGGKENLSGEITIYTSQPEEDIDQLIQKFNEGQPDITVNVFRSGTEEVVSKILAEKEADAIQADVLLVADSVTFESLKEQDMLLSYKSDELDGINEMFIDEDNTYTGTKIISTGIIVNTNEDTSNIKSFGDLVGDAYKDKVIMPSPIYSGAAAYNLGVITRSEELGWDYYEGLKSNGITVDKGNGAVLKAVAAGEKSAGIIVDYMAVRSANEGSPVEFVYPEEGSPVITEPIGILKGTEKEELAQVFVDFVLSEEGQTAASEMGYTPIKESVKAPLGLKSIKEINVMYSDNDLLLKEREADKEKFGTIFN